MNGRCETDPFDQAVDVCGSCYGEFCRTCLVETKGRKHPICRECAVVASGVRPGAKVVRRGDKRTSKQRRAELRAAPLEESFRYFDAEPSAAPSPEGPATEAPDPAPPATDEPTPGPGPEPVEEGAGPPAPSHPGLCPSAVDQLDRIRGQQADGDGEHGPDGAARSAEPGVDHGAGGLDDTGFRPPRPFIDTDAETGPTGMAALAELHAVRQSDDPSPPPEPGPEPTDAPPPASTAGRPATQARPGALPRRRRTDAARPEPDPAPPPAWTQARRGAAALPSRKGSRPRPGSGSGNVRSVDRPGVTPSGSDPGAPEAAAPAPLPRRRSSRRVDDTDGR